MHVKRVFVASLLSNTAGSIHCALGIELFEQSLQDGIALIVHELHALLQGSNDTQTFSTKVKSAQGTRV